MVEHMAGYFADFGIDVVIGAEALRGILDRPYHEVMGLVQGDRPTLVLPSADLPAIEVGDALTADGEGFTVQRIEPDGTGLTRLQLEAA